MTLPWISVDGARLVDEGGQTVRLKGVSLGGWMNMENFITGYPGAEQDVRRLMLDRMGSEAYEAYFESFYASFIDDADAAFLASIGINSMRIAVNYRHFEPLTAT